MKITDVKIRKLLDEPRVRAIVSVTFDDAIAVHDTKVIQGDNGLFVAMPSRRDKQGTFRDVVHPINAEMRKYIEDEVIRAYKKEVTAQSANCTATRNCENISKQSIAPKQV